MNPGPQPPTPVRTRRPPPPFRRMTVRRLERVTPRLVRVTFAGEELRGFSVDEPAASVRLLLPWPGTAELEVPTWQRNAFFLPDGRRPPVRTLTPLRVDPEAPALDLEIVVHGGGVASEWAEAAAPGDPAAISGPARGYPVDGDAPAFLLVGDESAIPAVSQLLEALPARTPVQVHLEVSHADARRALPDHPSAAVEWHDQAAEGPPGGTLVAAVQNLDLVPGTRVWAAGEAAAMQRIRRHLFEEREVPRPQTWVRGYWKHGRSGDSDDDT
ncbi:MAG: siderophore-interacting protein [Acidimicrobiia bacterium]